METIAEKEYLRWKRLAKDTETSAELEKIKGDSEKINDAFYRELEFGTAGLRGVIGAGTNRMNIYTVGRASQGLADYVVRHNTPEKRRIAISYDSRIKSDLFARTAAGVFAANGIRVFIYPELMPTPCLSYAVRTLDCAAGIMVTASHNPAKYNGYKVYGSDGCQITEEAAAEILDIIAGTDIFCDVKTSDFAEELGRGTVMYIPDTVSADFTREVLSQSMLGPEDNISRDVDIVYSPLNGTGLRPVLRALKEAGFTNVSVVEAQKNPDGNFPTCRYPNPEIREAMAEGIREAERLNAELLLATDPDCDRAGIAVRDGDDYRLLSGNETGMLLLDYICSQRIKNGRMPQNPVFVKTIVTSDMAQRIADKYGVKTVNVLTGFKYIGQQIAKLEENGSADSYILGFEESYGYLSGTYVRDKDAVNAAFLICEMFAYYKTRGISLVDKLNGLYAEFGHTRNTLYSYYYEGESGMGVMKAIMASLRGDISEIGGLKVIKVLDYSQGLEGLPKSDVMQFMLEGNCSVIVRPSGTEPKIKLYVSVCAKDEALATAGEGPIVTDMEKFLKK